MQKSVNTDNLPRKGKCIDWKKSIGYTCDFVYNNLKGTLKITNVIYKDKKHVVYVKYKDIDGKISSTSLKSGKLGALLNIISSNFKLNIGEILYKKNSTIEIIDREYRLTSYGRRWKWYKFKCLNCGKTHWMIEKALLDSTGCPYCQKHTNKITEGFNDIPTTAPWMIDYFPGGIEEAKHYTHSSGKKIIFKCPVCGKLSKRKRSIRDLYKYHTIGCQCDGKMSFPELVLYNLLSQFDIKFETQVSKSTFNWCGLSRYDFYLPDYNCIIETHGCQHYKQTKLIGRSLDEEQKNDVKKKNTALENGIQNYYEIDCRESTVKFIIDSCEKANLLQFLNINKNDIKFDDLYYNKFHDLIIKVKNEISKTPNISFSKILNKLNISRYDLTRILDILQIKLADNKLPIKIIKDNNLIAEYVSYQEFLRQAKGKDFYSTINTIKKYIKQGMLFKNKYKFILNNYVNNLDSTDKKF